MNVQANEILNDLLKDIYNQNIKNTKVSIDVNPVKSIYGYDRKNPNLNQYIKYNIKNKSLTKIYEQKKQSTNIASQSAFSINNISQSNNCVK